MKYEQLKHDESTVQCFFILYILSFKFYYNIDFIIYEMSQAYDSPEVDGLVQGESSEDATTSTSTRSNSHEEENKVPKNVPRLFAGYKKKDNSTANSSAASQFNRYLELCQEFEDRSPNVCLNFWLINRKNLSKMFPVAMRVLSVPASSSPIERVFDHGA